VLAVEAVLTGELLAITEGRHGFAGAAQATMGGLGGPYEAPHLTGLPGLADGARHEALLDGLGNALQIDPLDLRNWFGPMSDSKKAAALSQAEYAAKRLLAIEAGIIQGDKIPSCLS